MTKGQTAIVAVVAFLGGIAVDYFFLRSAFPRWVKHQPDARDALRVVKEDVAKTWEGGLGNFGIRPGDILMSVNGIKDQSMMQELIDGYNRGKVCAQYERDDVVREVCLETKN